MSYIDVTGKTEEEAVRKGLAQLGLERDDISVEILERAKSGFLGLGGNPARVRITYEGPEEHQETEEIPVPQEEQPEAPVQQIVEKPAPVEETVSDDPNVQRIQAFLAGLLEHLDSPAQVHVVQSEKGRYQVTLEGQKLGALIGRRGETLDAIQQLTNYAVNNGSEKRIRIHVDAENYRAKREQNLEALARKVAGKVAKYRRSVTLEPMNAYERHVIHSALQETPGVTTYSVGTEPNRRVVVSYDREKR